jgi:hypothetical protein
MQPMMTPGALERTSRRLLEAWSSHHEQALATDLSNFQTAEAWPEEQWRAPIEQQQEMPIIIDIVVMVEERCKTRSQQMQRHARK